MENLLQYSQPQEIFIVAFTSSNLGKNIITTLLSKKKRIRVLTPNINELNKILTDEERNKLDKIIIFDLNNSDNLKKQLKESFDTGNGETISYVISALTSMNEVTYRTEENNFKLNKLLIDECVTNSKIKRFSILSSQHEINYINPFLIFTSNRKLWYKQYYTNISEEYLRNSKLNYIIVKSIGLVESDKSSSFSIYQENYANHGQTTSATIGRVLADTIDDAWISSNVTFKCVTLSDQENSSYHYVQGLIRLNEDSLVKRRLEWNKYCKRMYMLCFMSGVFAFSFYIGRKFMLKIFVQKIFTYFKKMIEKSDSLIIK